MGANDEWRNYNMRKDIKKIADHFDEETQQKKLCEEMMELAISDSNANDDMFLDEVADVMILIMQRMYQRGLSKERLEIFMKRKLKRTIHRIETGYYD